MNPAKSLALPIAVVLAAPLHAQQSENSERIVVTATRVSEALDEQPYAISVISREEIERVLPRTVPEALNAIPGVLVQKTAPGHGSPYIRGFTGNRTLMVIDGVRYNNATFRDGANEYFAQIDPFTLEQIELVSGPASALYGSEAVGGVINLATRGTGMRANAGFFADGEQWLRVSGADQSVASRTALDIGEGGRWGLRGGVTVRDYGDIHAAEFGRLPNTGYSEQAVDARLDLALGPQWTATLNHQSLWQRDVPRTHSTIFAVPFAGTRAGTDLQRDKDHQRALTYLKLIGASDQPWLQSIEVTLSHQARTEVERRINADEETIDQSFSSDLFALSAVGTARFGALALSYGFDLSRELIDSARVDTDPDQGTVRVRLQGPVGSDASYDQAGVFLRAVGDLSDALTLEGSVRLSLVGTSIGQFADPVTGGLRSFEGDWADFSGSLRVSYTHAGHTLWAACSRSFRAPNVADISRFGPSRSQEIEVASLGLDPETFDTVELGYRGDFGAVNLGFNAYTTQLNDYIATVPTGRIRDGLIEVAKANAASGHVTGVEASLGAQLGAGFSLAGNATWLSGRLTAPTPDGLLEEPISRIQPLTGNVRMQWERGASWALAELTVSDRADELSSGDRLDFERIPPGGTPEFAVLNIRAGTQIGAGLALTLALNNAFDAAYRTHGSGINGAGRHVQLGVQLAL